MAEKVKNRLIRRFMVILGGVYFGSKGRTLNSAGA